MNQELKESAERLKQVIRRDLRLYEAINSSLYGPLMCLMQPKEKRAASSRMKKMISQVDNGVGQYSVEAMVL
jgi:hypothetical protein